MQADQSNSALNLKLRELATQVAEQEGCVLYDLEFQARVLRIFIDKEGGPSIDDCSKISKGLTLLLDENDPIPGGAYNLEVSTPGLERVLKEPWHFAKVQGKKIWVRLNKSLGEFGLQDPKLKSAKQLSEVLVEVLTDGLATSLATVDPEKDLSGGLRFQIENEEVLVPFSAVEKAKLVFEMEEKSSGSRGSGHGSKKDKKRDHKKK